MILEERIIYPFELQLARHGGKISIYQLSDGYREPAGNSSQDYIDIFGKEHITEDMQIFSFVRNIEFLLQGLREGGGKVYSI